MSKKEIVFTNKAPAPGAYSQAIKYGNLVFLSGQTPEDPVTGKPIKGDITVQTETVLNNLKAILEKAGSSLEKVLKVNIYLSDLSLKPGMNEVYKKFFPVDPPARIAMAVKGLDDGLDVEIDMIAAVD
jgi:2-iminobutanoate/2-iminopropanoate deaminase